MFDIAYLTLDSIQEGVGRSQILRPLEELSRRGVSIALITFEKSQPSKEIIQRVRAAAIDWTFLPFEYSSLPTTRRMMDLALHIPKAGLVHCRSDLPVATALVRKEPFLWDVRSFWADARVADGSLRNGSARFRVVKRLEAMAYRKCAGFVTLSYAGRQQLVAQYGHPRVPNRVIPTCADTEVFAETPMPPGHPLRIVMSGSYNKLYDLNIVGEFVATLNRTSTVEVIWARPQESRTTPPAYVSQVVAADDPDKLSKIIASGHVGVSVLSPNTSSMMAAAVPTKIGEFLACGRPVLVNPGLGDTKDLVAGGAGVDLYLHGLSEAADKVRLLTSSENTAARCRRIALQSFSLTGAVNQYLSLYDQILHKS